VPQVGVLADLCASSAGKAQVFSENAAGSARPTRRNLFVGRALPAVFAVALTLSTLAGCEPPAKQGGAPPPPSVSVTRPIRRDVIEWDDYTGRLSSPETANIAARVSGLIVQSPFKEGAIVHKGDLLFVIDDRPFKADLDSKQADVVKAKSQLDLADTNLKRLEKIRTSRAISESDYDAAKANDDQAQAAVAAAQAATENSQLYLDWTRVTSPIDGRISRQYVTVGNLVNGGSGQATLLTSVASVDPMYCYVSIPERAYLRYQQMAAQQHKSIADAKIPCFIQLENESTFPHKGVIDFTDNQIDPMTGTIQIRGVLPNPQDFLTSGLFARMRVPGSAQHDALLVPDQAIGTEQDEQFVLVAGPDDVVRLKPVKLGALFGRLRSVLQGVDPDDRVITEGIQLARPGTKVSPHEVPPPPLPPDLATTGAAATMPAATQSLPQTQPAAEAKP